MLMSRLLHVFPHALAEAALLSGLLFAGPGRLVFRVTYLEASFHEATGIDGDYGNLWLIVCFHCCKVCLVILISFCHSEYRCHGSHCLRDGLAGRTGEHPVLWV